MKGRPLRGGDEPSPGVVRLSGANRLDEGPPAQGRRRWRRLTAR